MIMLKTTSFGNLMVIAAMDSLFRPAQIFEYRLIDPMMYSCISRRMPIFRDSFGSTDMAVSKSGEKRSFKSTHRPVEASFTGSPSTGSFSACPCPCPSDVKTSFTCIEPPVPVKLHTRQFAVLRSLGSAIWGWNKYSRMAL